MTSGCLTTVDVAADERMPHEVNIACSRPYTLRRDRKKERGGNAYYEDKGYVIYLTGTGWVGV